MVDIIDEQIGSTIRKKLLPEALEATSKQKK